MKAKLSLQERQAEGVASRKEVGRRSTGGHRKENHGSDSGEVDDQVMSEVGCL